MEKRKINVGLIGIGTIGVGVARILLKDRARIRQKKQVDIVLKGIADISPKALKRIPGGKKLYTRDAQKLLNDPDIDIIIELIGGINPAKQFIRQALTGGKDVVTANKKLLAYAGKSLFALAEKKGTDLKFEASVCGGIPLIRSIQDGLVANEFDSLYGIVNGTTNYILTRMEETCEEFAVALKTAQDKGFAEANYKLDTRGEDAAQKAAILARVAFKSAFPISSIYREGIEHITPQDIRYARDFGYRIKLLAIIKKLGTGLQVRVHPALIPLQSSLASVRNEFNAVLLNGDQTGRLVFFGKGAGCYPTASAVVGDVIDLARKRQYGIPSAAAENNIRQNRFPLVPATEAKLSYYFRFGVADRPGVLAAIARILAANHISIAAVIQKGHAGRDGVVPIVMLTHEAHEKTVRRAVTRIDAMDMVKKKTHIIRVVHLP